MEKSMNETNRNEITARVQVIRYGVSILIALFLSVILSLLLIWNATPLREVALLLVQVSDRESLADPVPVDQLASRQASLEQEVDRQLKQIESFIPRQPYLIINTTHNIFRLMSYDQVIREGRCSTGSYIILTTGTNQKWIFETPSGMMKVMSRQMYPVWVKPDWAFIEEGLPVPSPRHVSRYEYGTLGDYKLELGDGYLIHGTLYKRFLGLAVTHGCIRMGDEDLKVVYRNLRKGSKVFIY
ncbi:MAG: L,D-transpeptidase [Bacteroidota bacterium]